MTTLQFTLGPVVPHADTEKWAPSRSSESVQCPFLFRFIELDSRWFGCSRTGPFFSRGCVTVSSAFTPLGISLRLKFHGPSEQNGPPLGGAYYADHWAIFTRRLSLVVPVRIAPIKQRKKDRCAYEKRRNCRRGRDVVLKLSRRRPFWLINRKTRRGRVKRSAWSPNAICRPDFYTYRHLLIKSQAKSRKRENQIQKLLSGRHLLKDWQVDLLALLSTVVGTRHA